ncbi:dephospho-CoA kinase [Undibacterium rugosum]|uniref:Dephospho-CoA kinase n=3 Tax=Undibacterium TaxID=401469 RepID=A0A923I484_9BURK|nr:dephospho-CoA kinase [Undibacterium rugosum]MBC3935201.1 dephospho-CoA kinase [Undibacterium rugosum]MBR7777795.1 dephospho-CoA kinase [Undibacterium rugosum]
MHQEKFSLGLTGGIGSGKTTIANAFQAQGASLIDTDLIAHALTQKDGLAIPQIRAEFGDQAISIDGSMDRARMRALVFNDSAAKLRLEAILHPLIRSQTEQAAASATGDYLIFVVPLLFESGNWRQRVDRILVIDCAEEIQIARVMQRNQLSREQVLAVMRNQASRQERLAGADDIILNEEALHLLQPQILTLHHNYLRLAAKKTVNG